MASSNTFPHVIEATSLADLASIHVAELNFGAICWVDDQNAAFTLTQTPNSPPDGITVVSPVAQAAVGKPGAAWEKGGGGGGGTEFLEGVTLAQLATIHGNDANSLAFVFDTRALYRWSPGGVATADGWTIVNAPGGQWVIEGDTLQLSALGGGTNDAPRVQSAANALAQKGGTVMLLPTNGRFEFASQCQLFSPVGVTIAGTPGATEVHGSIAPTGGALFLADGWNARVAASTLSNDVVVGTRTLQVVGLGGVVVGSQILLFSPINSAANYTVMGIVGTTLTVDRPIRKPYLTGDAVSISPGFPTSIRFTGLRLTGTADIAIELIGGETDCSMYDLEVCGTWNLWTLNFDYAPLRCVADEIRTVAIPGSPLNSSTGWFLGFEAGESCSARAVAGAGACSIGFLLNTCVDVHHEACSFAGATVGIEYAPESAAGTGCFDCSCSDSDFSYSASVGAAINDGSRDIRLNTVAARGCPTGIALTSNATVLPPQRAVIVGADCRSCGTGVLVSGGDGHRFLATDVTGCTALGFDLGATYAMSGLVIEDPVVVDVVGRGIFLKNGVATRATTVRGGRFVRTRDQALDVAPGAQDTLLEEAYIEDCATTVANGIGIGAENRMRIVDVTIVDTVDPGILNYKIFSAVANSDILIRGVRWFMPKSNSGLYCAMVSTAAGTVFRVQESLVVDGGGGGAGNRTFYFSNAANFFQRGRDVDDHVCETDTSLAGGAQQNYGTFNVNGATPVPVAWGLTRAQTRVRTKRMTAGGAAGAEPTFTRTAGTGVNFTGTAADTSTYEYDLDGG